MLPIALGLAAIPAGVLLFVLAGYPLLVRLRARGRRAPSDVAIARARAAGAPTRSPSVNCNEQGSCGWHGWVEGGVFTDA